MSDASSRSQSTLLDVLPSELAELEAACGQGDGHREAERRYERMLRYRQLAAMAENRDRIASRLRDPAER